MKHEEKLLNNDICAILFEDVPVSKYADNLCRENFKCNQSNCADTYPAHITCPVFRQCAIFDKGIIQYGCYNNNRYLCKKAAI